MTNGAAASDPQVVINDLNIGSIPAECARTFGKRILEPKALLVIQNLLWGGLAGVDDGMTLKMVRLNVLGRSHGEPPVRCSRLPCGWVGGSLRRAVPRRSGARHAWIPPVSHKTEKYTNGVGGDFGAWRRGGAIGVIRGGGGDAQDDAVAVLNLKRQGFAKRTELDGYPEGASVERVTRIDDGDGLDVSLTVHAARGIKNIPRSSAASTRTPGRTIVTAKSGFSIGCVS